MVGAGSGASWLVTKRELFHLWSCIMYGSLSLALVLFPFNFFGKQQFDGETRIFSKSLQGKL